MKKIDIIKICIIIITICLLYTAIRSIYYDYSRYTISNHNERKAICDAGNLTYIKSLQNNKNIVTCCELQDNIIIYCKDILWK